jgi:hypothetical protein
MRGISIFATALLSATPNNNVYNYISVVNARLADRSRVVKARGGNRDYNNLAIEGGAYRGRASLAYTGGADDEQDVNNTPTVSQEKRRATQQSNNNNNKRVLKSNPQLSTPEQQKLRGGGSGLNNIQDEQINNGDVKIYEQPEHFSRRLSSQLTGCCYTYQSYAATDMCSLYGEDCESGETPSHDSGDESCEQEGLSFIGVSFSVNTASGNPYSYQLCDQFPMENIIDRNYDYVMSMDEDGWLVGGGYKSFDYSGKMP